MPSHAIDRWALVHRHNPVLTQAHPTSALTVGNGDIAMTVDVTGLATFAPLHELRPDPDRVPHDGSKGLPEHTRREYDRDNFQIPLRTQSTWGWYSTRCRADVLEDDATTTYLTARGPVPYLDRMGLLRAGDPIPDELLPGAWLSFNPRRSHLGRLVLTANGHAVTPGDVTCATTELDLWSGVVSARLQVRGHDVAVTTVAHPSAHRFATRVTSPTFPDWLSVSWVFDPQPDDLAPFELPLEESTVWEQTASDRATATRVVESSTYTVDVQTTGTVSTPPGGDRAVAHAPSGRTALDVVVSLAPGHLREAAPQSSADFADVRDASASWWRDYWSRGAVASLEGSTDPRAVELERRTVLSQYLTVVNGAGATPPAETGLTYNTWTGKFHLEMHWWHAAHFPMWGRGALLERSLRWYHDTLRAATRTARRQGYRGARWPKQTDLSGRESPSHIGVFLVWQQPHVIHLLELLYQEGRSSAFLREHYPLVEATAEFMADFAELRDGTYHLPSPLIPAQESYLADRATNEDPTFELLYWSWALTVANSWRERLGLEPRESWRDVAAHMASPRIMPSGGYAALATPPYLVRKDHPSMLMALGWLPASEAVDRAAMAATLHDVWQSWDLYTTWGWDYSTLAMTAAALGDLRLALDALLMRSPKNEYLPNGHNPQIPGFLTLYLPANGGLLAAVAHLAAAIERGAALPPGWTLTTEGFSTLPALQAEGASLREGIS